MSWRDRIERQSYEDWMNEKAADVERDSKMETEMQDETARDAWRRWWDEEGSGMRPLPNEDAEQFARRMTEIAWSNGAFKRLVDVDNLRAELAAANARVAELESEKPSDCEVRQAVMMNREAELRVTCSALAGIYANPNAVGDPVRNGQIAAVAAKAALDALSQPRAWSTCDPVRDLCGDRESDLDGEALVAMRKGEQP